MRGIVLVSVAIVSGFAGFFLWIHPFLAVSSPVEAQILVVEGWLSPESLAGAVVEGKKACYHKVVVTIPWQTNRTAVPGAVNRLLSAGIPDHKVADIYPAKSDRHRTLHSALALNSWLKSQQFYPAGVNVHSEGVHARRSRLLFQHALGPDINVGVIAGDPPYEAGRWWTQSDGVKEVIGETIGYIYFKLSILWSGLS